MKSLTGQDTSSITSVEFADEVEDEVEGTLTDWEDEETEVLTEGVVVREEVVVVVAELWLVVAISPAAAIIIMTTTIIPAVATLLNANFALEKRETGIYRTYVRLDLIPIIKESAVQL